MSVFVLSPDIEDRDGVEVPTGRSTKRPSTLNDILFYLRADHKKKFEHILIYLFSFTAVPVKWQFSNLQFSPVIPSSLVVILLVLGGSKLIY
jgi:hypothetical protein